MMQLYMPNGMMQLDAYNPAMRRSSFENMNCSLARALELVGEWWTLLIVREAMWGTSRFDDFHQRLGIARNILSARLAKLEQDGIVERRATAQSARIHDYVLTDKGWDLFTPVVALMQWGDRWIHTKAGPPIQFFDGDSGKPIQTLAVRNAAGKLLPPAQVDIRPGPGARAATVKRAEAARKAAGWSG
jgi:DNA-binding HxlR family transcriptional regulator